VVGATRPDLTLLLDIDPKVGLARADQRRGAVAAAQTTGGFVAADNFEGRQLDFHRRLREGFLAIAKAEPQRVRVFDAFENADALADRIWAEIQIRFGIV
jgi:dTMP kinase